MMELIIQFCCLIKVDCVMANESLKQLLLQSMDDVESAFQEVENSDELISCVRKIIPLKEEITKL